MTPPRADRLPPLCPYRDDPARAPDPVLLDCPVERLSFRAGPPPERDALTVVAYNLERGLRWREQLALLRDHPDLARADVLLLAEADRGCSRVGGAHVARELAEGLGLELAFAVQYLELPRRAKRLVDQVDAPCEHGNAILSRLPLEDVQALRHPRTVAWHRNRREPRLGGCVTLAATVRCAGRAVRVYGVHFDSRLRHGAFRAGQARDLVADAAAHDGPVVIGGDLNAYLHTLDVWLGTGLDRAVSTLQRGGFVDAHAGLRPWRRGTTGRRYLVRGAIDLVLTRELTVEASGIVGPREAGALSDHLPVWARVRPGLSPSSPAR